MLCVNMIYQRVFSDIPNYEMAVLRTIIEILSVLCWMTFNFVININKEGK